MLELHIWIMYRVRVIEEFTYCTVAIVLFGVCMRETRQVGMVKTPSI